MPKNKDEKVRINTTPELHREFDSVDPFDVKPVEGRRPAPKLTPELLNKPGSEIGVFSGFATADNPPNDELKVVNGPKE